MRHPQLYRETMNIRRHDFVATLTRSALAADYLFRSAPPHRMLLLSFIEAFVHSFNCSSFHLFMYSNVGAHMHSKLVSAYDYITCGCKQSEHTS